MMAKIAEETEQHLRGHLLERQRDIKSRVTISSTIAHMSVRAAEELEASCIIAATMTGTTARYLSNFRPPCVIAGVTPNEWVMRRMQLYWGVTPLLGDVQGDTDYVIEQARRIVLERGLADVGDIGVFTVGDRDTSPNADRAAFAPTNIMYVVELHPEDIPESDPGL